MYASLRSIGAYIPQKAFTNADMEKMVETSDEWIKKRTGIETRHFAEANEATSDLATKAAKVAMERAGVKPGEIDMLITATISPDYLCMPSTACVIAHNLGIEDKPAFDISAACSGFIYLLSIAKAYIESGMAKTILVIGAEKLSAITDFTDRSTCVLFGDGAGAAIIGATDSKEEAILDVNIAANGKYQDFLMTPGCGSRHPASQEVIDQRLQFMKMKGNETFKLAVKTLSNDVKEILERNHLTSKEIHHFIPHQANYRIIKAVGDLLDFTPEQIAITVDRFGNTSAASIPMAMNALYEEGRLKNGEKVLLDAFGGGLTWGSAILTFCGR
ncbi:beta-ketoacyl-ACP synthase III [Wolinella succinogenes]|uniref:beta-ketoacyl-ACP synthase III n=1 Tax=Wolinella succinogenes TaxID=844 RepID=UPI00240A7903|nr:beta-ketoacyl-ACP synthase III [Wolinella succinogenes]